MNYSKKAAKESYNNQIYNVLIDNLLVCVVTLHDEFGFGEKRINDFINGVMKTVVDFDEAASDGVLDVITVEERKRYRDKFREILRIRTKNYMSEDFYNEIFSSRSPTKTEIELRAKADKRARSVSMSEAALIQKKAQAFGDYLKDKDMEVGKRCIL